MASGEDEFPLLLYEEVQAIALWVDGPIRCNVEMIKSIIAHRGC